MIKSALVRRIIAVIALGVLLTAVFTWILFMYISRSVFMHLKASELIPRAQSLTRLADDYLSGARDEEQSDLFLSLVDVNETDASILNAYLAVANREGKVVFLSDARTPSPADGMADIIARLLSKGEPLYTQSRTQYGNIVLVGVPVRAQDGAINGALILYVPEYETLAARGSLLSALALSLVIALPVMLLLVYALVYRLVLPLREMRDVAIHMADGRYDRRANEDAPGEIGQLGSSLNRLSRALKHTFSALTFERNRLVQILNGLSEGIAAVDSLGNITHINPSLEMLFPPEEGETDPRRHVIARADVWEAFDRAVKSGEGAHFTIKDAERDILCVISPVYDDVGGIAGAVGLFRDISQYVHLEATRREYVANVSHELRTPLTAMRGLIEPLRDGMVSSDEAKKRYYDIILREVMRLTRLINDLMELSRLQSGQLAFTMEKFDLVELTSDLKERYAAIAADNGLTLKSDTDFAAFPPVESNSDRVEQILVILLDNAIKYTPNGGEITLSGEFSCDRATLCVSDTGVGIAREHIDHVFDRFYKVDKSHGGLGSGLGLSIASEMLSKMGERIWVTSEPGKGSAFYFTVRLFGAPEARKPQDQLAP